jgi:outer membrane protein
MRCTENSRPIPVVDTGPMHRKSCRRMIRRTALAASLTLLSTSAYADPIFWAARLAAQDAPGPGAKATPVNPPAPAPAPGQPGSATASSLADIAGPATSVTLADILQATIRHAPSLQAARLDVEIALATIEESYGLTDWILGARVQAAWNDDAVPRRSAIETDVERTIGVDGEVSLTKLMSTGGTFGITAASGWGRATVNAPRFDPADPEMPVGYSNLDVDEYSDSLTANLTQPLLRGRGREIALAAQASARIQRDAATLQQRSVAIEQVRTVVQAYWDLVFSLRDLEIRRSSLDLARERLRLTQAGINGGKVAPSEALAVEQVIATREEEVLATELSVLDQSIALRRTAGLEIKPGALTLTTETELAVPPRTWDLATLASTAQVQSPELAVLGAQEAGATIDVEIAENGLMPRLDLGLSLGTGATGRTFSAALEDTVTLEGYTALASLTYEQALGNDAAEGRTRRARAQREKVRVNAVDVRFQINEAMARAVALVRSAEQRVELGARAVKLAEQNIGVEQSRFNLGKSTNFDVLQRQDELKQAQLRQARAVVDFHKAQTVIQSLTGEILDVYGINIDAKAK